MELIQTIIQESVSGGFWRFVGHWVMIALIMGIPVSLVKFIINRILRHWSIRKHGYPPTHCDADGDFKED